MFVCLDDQATAETSNMMYGRFLSTNPSNAILMQHNEDAESESQANQ
jgi:hypothetical protein